MKARFSFFSIFVLLFSLAISGQHQNRAVTIHDIQFTNDPGGESPYNGDTVTVKK